MKGFLIAQGNLKKKREKFYENEEINWQLFIWLFSVLFDCTEAQGGFVPRKSLNIKIEVQLF